MNSISQAVNSRTPKKLEGVVFIDNITGESLKVPDPKEPKEDDSRGKRSKGTGLNPASAVQLSALADKFAK